MIYFSDPLFIYSPEITRPPSPQRYLSDTEVEINQSQEDHSIDSEISWAWGKLPKVQYVEDDCDGEEIST